MPVTSLAVPVPTRLACAAALLLAGACRPAGDVPAATLNGPAAVHTDRMALETGSPATGWGGFTAA